MEEQIKGLAEFETQILARKQELFEAEFNAKKPWTVKQYYKTVRREIEQSLEKVLSSPNKRIKGLVRAYVLSRQSVKYQFEGLHEWETFDNWMYSALIGSCSCELKLQQTPYTKKFGLAGDLNIVYSDTIEPICDGYSLVNADPFRLSVYLVTEDSCTTHIAEQIAKKYASAGIHVTLPYLDTDEPPYLQFSLFKPVKDKRELIIGSDPKIIKQVLRRMKNSLPKEIPGFDDLKSIDSLISAGLEFFETIAMPEIMSALQSYPPGRQKLIQQYDNSCIRNINLALKRAGIKD